MKKIEMNSKIKILLGLLVVGILLLSGCLEESSKPATTTIPPSSTTTTIPEKGVTITTDKTDYMWGETIKITIKNNLDESIWYREWSDTCKYDKYGGCKRGNGTSFSIGKKKGEEYSFYSLDLVKYERDEVEVMPKATGTYTLTLDEWIKVRFPHIDISEGVYKWGVTYTLKSRSKDLKTIYSNEFTIKNATFCKQDSDCPPRNCCASKEVIGLDDGCSSIMRCVNGICRCECICLF